MSGPRFVLWVIGKALLKTSDKMWSTANRKTNASLTDSRSSSMSETTIEEARLVLDISTLRSGINLPKFSSSLRESGYTLVIPQSLYELFVSRDVSEEDRVWLLNAYGIPSDGATVDKKRSELLELSPDKTVFYSVPEDERDSSREAPLSRRVRDVIEREFGQLDDYPRQLFHQFVIEVVHACEEGQKIANKVVRSGLVLFGRGRKLANRTLDILRQAGETIVHSSQQAGTAIARFFRRQSERKAEFIKKHPEFLVEITVDGVYLAIAVFFIGPHTVHAGLHFGKDVLIFVYNGTSHSSEPFNVPPNL